METTKEINELCQELLDRYKKAVIDSDHSASGDLVRTATYKTRFAGSLFIVSFQLEYYWKYLENGRKPGLKQPPLEPIEKWIEVRHIKPKLKTPNQKPPTTKQLAFVIARGIGKNGIPATKLLQKTINSSDDLIDQIKAELIKQLEEEIYKEIKL